MQRWIAALTVVKFPIFFRRAKPRAGWEWQIDQN
jgi:hypothetical protein